MSDRYRDSRDSYTDEQYDRYEDGRYADSGRRSARPTDDRYAGPSQRSSRSYSRDSGAYSSSAYRPASSTRSSNGAGAYSNGYRSANEGQRYSQGSDAGYRQSDAGRSQNPNLFADYYPEDTAEAYSRSSYGSGASRSSSARSSASHRSRSSYQQSPAQGRTVTPAQTGRGGYGSRAYGSTGASNGGHAPKRSNRKRNIIIAAVVVLAVVLIGAGAAWAYVHNIDENLHKGVTQETLEALEPAEGSGEITKTSLSEAPFYMLLMGVDMAEWRRELPEYAGDEWGRTDSMILARIDPINKKVALISIHRDTMVDLGEYGQQKINAAYEFYGPAGAIKAVSTMAGVPISHYATVDFDGFSALVDALGGVEVNVPMEINDEVMPAHLDAGWQTLNGDDALVLCRSRHSYDDVADDGDVMRAANQRMVIGAIAKKILASDIMTIANTVTTLSKYVTTDLSVSDIVGLAQIFQGVNPDNDIYTAMEPTTSAYIDDTWYEYLDQERWQEMINRMDQGLPPVNKTEIDDATGTILSTGGADAPVV